MQAPVWGLIAARMLTCRTQGLTENGLGGGAIETADIFGHHLAVQTDAWLHQRTIAEVKKFQIQDDQLSKPCQLRGAHGPVT
jgi:hypothetical protein